MKKIFIIMAGLLLISLNVFAQDDVSIDSNGNVTTGVANPDGNLEVEGASGEDAIVGRANDTGAAGVYGEHMTAGNRDNYGILGDDNYGVFGHNPSGYAGYFQGNARVTGDLTVDGALSAPGIGDITGVTAGLGLTGGGPSGTVTLNADTGVLQTRVSGSCPAGQSIRVISPTGTVTCEVDDVGIAAESDPEVGANTLNYVPKWNGSALSTGSIYDDGNVGIGTASPAEKLTVVGTIESTSGGIKFPDGTIQTTAAAPSWHQILPSEERFVLAMNDEAVLDKETGLVWEKSPSTSTYTWANALYHCAMLEVGGRKGWHLPTIEQLATLVDSSQTSPSLPGGHPFLNVQSAVYYSSTTVEGNSANAWYVYFDNGSVSGYSKAFGGYAWCVRGGQSYNAY